MLGGRPTINGFSLTGQFLPGPPLLNLAAAFNQVDELLLAVNSQLGVQRVGVVAHRVGRIPQLVSDDGTAATAHGEQGNLFLGLRETCFGCKVCETPRIGGRFGDRRDRCD